MNTSTVKLYSWDYSQLRTYTTAAMFILGNMALPQLCHLVPDGGRILLPIYFFTLIGAYKYGWRVGLLTALLSPVLNSALFGMPAVAALPVILFKSTLLALAAGYAASKFKRVSVAILTGVVLFYQTVGSAVEWALTGSFAEGMSDFTSGLAGMAIQILGGWAVIRWVIRK